MIVKQINANGDKNFTYIIADEFSGEAAIIDPSYAAVELLDILKATKLKLKYLINTHAHYDHTYGNAEILLHTDATLVGATKFKHGLCVKDGSVLQLGKLQLKIIATPGHTKDSICILVENKLFTGDTLFVGDVGLTASREDALVEFNSIKKILALPDATEIYPGHDYGAIPHSTIQYEKQNSICIQNVLQNDFASFLLNK